MLVEWLIGEPLDQMATKNRGQALERLVACLLGYKISDAELLEGKFPDIPNQALEVKVQDSPTVRSRKIQSPVRRVRTVLP